MLKYIFTITLSWMIWSYGVSQSELTLKWWNPAHGELQVLEGQAWPGEVEGYYDRLPARAKNQVREPVWNLSKDAAGLMLRFRTDAQNVTVRYAVGGNHAMNHMPATGVSGVDLYAVGDNGSLQWCIGKRNFSDTVMYQFNGLSAPDQGREYRLYLPLYNSVTWMEVGVAKEALFEPLQVRDKKPIVVYGTSIAQGACASRPGMAWTNILQRKVDGPLINLAFSGNGRLEKEMIDLLAEINAEVYVLDCLPNLTNEKLYDDQELSKRVLESVRKLKEKQPEIPVLLVDHAGYVEGLVQTAREKTYKRVNSIQKEAFDQLKTEGYTNIHYLSKEALDLKLDDTVDGSHPNDLGMMHYAESYENALKPILSQ